MNRWKWIKLAAAIVVMMTFLAVPVFLRRERHELRSDAPNVLFIVLDDMNDWVGCLGGHPDAYTPNIDRLAQRGVLFTNAHAPAPLSNPSRTAVLTGVRPSTSGVYGNFASFRDVLPKVVTLPGHFMVHGYKVMGTGKIFHDKFPDPKSWRTYFPSKKFDLFDPTSKSQPLNIIPGVPRYVGWGPLDDKEEDITDFKRARWVAEQLKQKHKQPFFLAIGFKKPHLPWCVPRKYFERFPPDSIALPEVDENDLQDIPSASPPDDLDLYKKIMEQHQWRKAIAAYLASISFADAMVGRILDALDAGPYSGNTIIVLWGDNGFHLGEKRHWGKITLWEESTRVPLIFVVPGVTESGGRSSRSVSLMDIYPTLIELCGLSMRAGLEGKSLIPLLKDPGASWDWPALTTLGRNDHAVRSERWRYIQYYDGSEELYDHETDDLEWHNLAERPEYADVKKVLAQWIPVKRAQPAPEFQESF